MMDVVLFEQLKQLEQKIGTSRSDVYLKACSNVINRLPLLQRTPLKYYFGIGVETPLTQEEIADRLGIAQKNVATRIDRAMKNLKVLIRKELPKVVREELNEQDKKAEEADHGSL